MEIPSTAKENKASSAPTGPHSKVVTIAAITAVARRDRKVCCVSGGKILISTCFAPGIGWTKQEEGKPAAIGVRALRFAYSYTPNRSIVGRVPEVTRCYR